MIPQSFIQDLLARVDIVDVVERYVPLKKAGANYQACCPFHNEKSPSFTVSPTKQFYHCFGCGAHGTAIGFLMEYAGLSYPDAIRDLAGKMGVQVPEEKHAGPVEKKPTTLYDALADASRFYREQLKGSEKAIAYLKQRGLTGEVAARFGIGYAPDEWSALKQVFPDYNAKDLLDAGLVIENDQGRRYDRFRDRVMFPILDAKGNVIGFGGRVLGQGEPKYLNSPETPVFEKGRELYGLVQAQKAIRGEGAVIVVEGYMDVVALAQFGVGNAVATLGTATTPNHVHKLLRLADRVVFCFDGDAAGRKAAWRALEASLEQLPDGKVAAFLFLPPEHDPDSFVREHGADAYRLKAQEALPLTEFLLQELRSRVNLATAEGRSRLIVDAKPLLQRLKAPLLRLQVVRALAHSAGMEPREVEGLCGLAPLAAPPRQSAAPRGAPRRAPPPKLKGLLKIVLEKPTWSARLPLEVLDLGGQEGEILRALADAVDHGELPRGGMAMVIEYFRGSEHEGFLHGVAEEVLADKRNEEVLEAEFNDHLEGLRQDLVRQEIAALTAKARSGGLDEGERRRLSELLAQKQGLKSTQAGKGL